MGAGRLFSEGKHGCIFKKLCKDVYLAYSSVYSDGLLDILSHEVEQSIT